MDSGGTPPSPYDVGELIDGVEICHFTVTYSNTAPNPLTSIVAWNAPTSPYTQIQVTDAVTNVARTFPLPTSGAKENGATSPYRGWFKTTLTPAQMAAQGFVNFFDIGSYTVF